MASRCFTDPLDPADDVCDTCYGNYCLEHLVHAKGRKNPICIECALRLSGVRSGGKIPPVDDPKTAASRRAELKRDSQKERPVFLYFDDPDANLVREPEVYESSLTQAPAFSPETPTSTTPAADIGSPYTAPVNETSSDDTVEVRDLPMRPPSGDGNNHVESERLPPVITTQSTILDQIVKDKQNRAEQLAQEMADRLENTP